MSSFNKIAAHDWKERAIAEYLSAAHCSHAVTLMIQSGVSPDYIEDGLANVAQEIRHAEESLKLSIELGSESQTLAINPESFDDPYNVQMRSIAKLAHLCARFFCCAEFVGTRLQQKMLENASQASAFQLLTSIVNEEKEHSSLGWDLIEDLVPNLDHLELSSLKAAIPKYIDEIEAYYDCNHTYSSEELSWGLLNGSDYQRISSLSLRELEDKFYKLGLIDLRRRIHTTKKSGHKLSEVSL